MLLCSRTQPQAWVPTALALIVITCPALGGTSNNQQSRTFRCLAANLVAHDIKARPEEEVEQRACLESGEARRRGQWQLAICQLALRVRTLSRALRAKHGDEVIVEAYARELPRRQRVGQVGTVRMPQPAHVKRVRRAREGKYATRTGLGHRRR